MTLWDNCAGASVDQPAVATIIFFQAILAPMSWKKAPFGDQIRCGWNLDFALDITARAQSKHLKLWQQLQGLLSGKKVSRALQQCLGLLWATSTGLTSIPAGATLQGPQQPSRHDVRGPRGSKCAAGQWFGSLNPGT